MDVQEYLFFRYTFSKVLINPLGSMWLFIVISSILIAIFTDLLASFNSYRQNITEALKGKSEEHWPGQNNFGRDILSRIIYGTRVSLLTIAFVAILGPSLNIVIIALCNIGWKSYARLVRGEILKEKDKEYIQATKVLGFSHLRIIFNHLIPKTLNPVIVMATLGVASMIISEAGLSFLGLAIMVLVLGFYFPGDAFRDALDPYIKVLRDI